MGWRGGGGEGGGEQICDERVGGPGRRAAAGDDSPVCVKQLLLGEIFVVGKDKVGSLNTGNRDVVSDDVNNTVDTREIISRLKPDLLSRLKSVAAGAA